MGEFLYKRIKKNEEMKISVVIPAHNEEKNIEKITKLLFNNFQKEINEIIFVNDCSTDKTKVILKHLAKQNQKIVVVNRGKNRGVGNAIIAGLKEISPISDYVLLLDCDFIENTNNIKAMLQHAKNFDGIIGSRYLKKGSLKNYPLLKKIANRSFHLLIRLFLGISYIDLSNNFKLYKTSIIKQILPLLKSSGFSINAETGLYPILLGFNLKEIPVIWIGRTHDMGKSNFNVLKAGPGYLKVLKEAIQLKYFPSTNIRSSFEESEANHFDQLIEKTGETYYGNLRPVAPIRFIRKSETILRLLKGMKDPKILELGCGTGILSRFLLERSRSLHIEGIDISSKAVAVANKNLQQYPNTRFRVGSVTRLPYRSSSFNIVIGNSVLHHVPMKQTLLEISRVLKSNGKVWFCEPNALNPQISVEKNFSLIKPFFQDSPHERAFTRWEIYKDLKEDGFKNIKIKPYEFLHPLLPKFALKLFVPFCIWLEKVPLINEFAGTLQITAVNKRK